MLGFSRTRGSSVRMGNCGQYEQCAPGILPAALSRANKSRASPKIVKRYANSYISLDFMQRRSFNVELVENTILSRGHSCQLSPRPCQDFLFFSFSTGACACRSPMEISVSSTGNLWPKMKQSARGQMMDAR